MGEQTSMTFDPKDILHERLFGDVNKDLLARFKEFHTANPNIYELFKKYAIEARKSGRKRFSHWMIINRIRWYTNVETQGDDFKINNDFIAIYARLLVWQMPEFDGFFMLRQCQSGKEEAA